MIYAEILAFIISVITYRHLKGTPFRPFPFFLLFIVLIELTGRYMTRILHVHNAWLFNISTTIEFIFYAYIFNRTLQTPRYKITTRWFIIIYPILVTLNILFIQGPTNWHSYTYTLGSACVILFCVLFFYELLLNPVEETLQHDPLFWFTTGILFFYLGGLSFNLLYNLLQRYATSTAGKLFQNINNNLILILYSCFIMAFLCKRTLPRSLSR